VFDPGQAFLYSLSGALLSASCAYGVGRLAGTHVLRQLDGPRLRKLRQRLHTQAFRATVVARLLPVGNFTVINMFAGALRVPFVSFTAGNVVGMVFGIGGITFLADRLAAAWHTPTLANIALLLCYVAGLFGVSLGLSKLFERHQRK
jgi:phospholipase D1/2